MKAVVCTAYGPPEVLQIEEVSKPVPKASQVLVKVMASTVAVADCRVRSFKVPLSMWLPARILLGITKPKNAILGAEFSGIVSTVGKKVTRFKEGDPVLGVSLPKFGAYGEYLCVDEDGPIVKKPVEIPWGKAAAIPIGATTAFCYLNAINILPNQKILIYGASGSVGTYAVQLAKMKGAKVTAVCSQQNFEMVKNLGAELAIDYNQVEWHKGLTLYDMFFQAVDKCPFRIAETTLKKEGAYINITNPFPSIRMLLAKIRKKIKLHMAKDFPQTNENLEHLVKLIAKEEVNVVVDTTFQLDNIVAAHRYVDQGHKKGNVVVQIK